MDASVITLFLDESSSKCISSENFFLDEISNSGGWKYVLLDAVDWHNKTWSNQPHYWTGHQNKREQFAENAETYSALREHLSEETFSVRGKLLHIAENLQLFGSSAIELIDSSSAGTNTQNFTQAQIDSLDSSLLSVEDCSCVQSFSSHMDALYTTTSSALEDVAIFQNKVSECKLLLANNVRPTIEAVLAFNCPTAEDFYKNTRTAIDNANLNGTSEYLALTLEGMYLDLQTALEYQHMLPPSPLHFNGLLETFMKFSENICRVLPALSKFEVLWIETLSFIKNSKENAENIQTVKMLKVFRTRMQKIMNDWNNVKALLGAQPIPLQ
ncbi:hypothetical protein [Pseudomonas sp. EA_65y_Pfl1_P113]|uniref:hypothetical protein n=1 Tax=Pseudomonas sp. EA_65y_Pfl1_P113 TaxID=3088692 RepID=UPI0030DB9456